MALQIETFNNSVGGSALYKAISHPLAANQAPALNTELEKNGPATIYDPTETTDAYDVFYPLHQVAIGGLFVQKLEDLGRRFRNHPARPVTELAKTNCRSVLIASFDKRTTDQARLYLPAEAKRFSFEPL